MAKGRVVLLGVVILVLLGGPLFAQSLKGMSFNGSTGLMSIPSGRIGWERSADFGFDLGYHAIFDDGDTTHIPKASVSLFKLLEASFAYDAQPGDDNEDIIIGGKIQLPTDRTAVALGANFQMLQENGEDENVQQIYIAATYPGEFFNMPAETTFVLGKSFGDIIDDEWIDFGMGFDLLLLPDIFQGYVHWINDFSNFSYSWDAFGANAVERGVFNTGIRIDIAANPSLSKYKFVIDAIVTDALDEARSLALGVAFGAPIQ
ncbi:MAG: hypothetical protein ACOC25_09150 [Alkalispirochaetaceae bacterium]